MKTVEVNLNSGHEDEAWCEWFTCPKCGYDIMAHSNYCSNCGSKIKWVDE